MLAKRGSELGLYNWFVEVHCGFFVGNQKWVMDGLAGNINYGIDSFYFGEGIESYVFLHLYDLCYCIKAEYFSLVYIIQKF